MASLVQNLGRPPAVGVARSLLGDTFDVTGFIPITGHGEIGYSFRGPALVGSGGGLAPVTTSVVGEGMIDVAFPVRFYEKPFFCQGFEFVTNYSGDWSVAVAAVVSWRLGRRAETASAYYEGVRLRVMV